MMTDQERIKQLEGLLANWRECALYDATMEGPVFKGWDRSALERARRADAQADTRPKGGDAKQAPFTGSAVGEADAPKGDQ